MSLRTTIHSALQASTTLGDLIGSAASMRHYVLRAPQAAVLPYLVSQVIATDPAQSHGTATDGEDGLDEALVQFTAVAEDPDAASAIIAAVRAAFMDPAAQAASAAVLAAAKVIPTAPRLREVMADEVEACAAQLDLTFFHNPST